MSYLDTLSHMDHMSSFKTTKNRVIVRTRSSYSSNRNFDLIPEVCRFPSKFAWAQGKPSLLIISISMIHLKPRFTFIQISRIIILGCFYKRKYKVVLVLHFDEAAREALKSIKMISFLKQLKSNYSKCLGVHLTKRSVQQFSTNLIPIHPFSTPWKHHGGVQKGSIEKNGLKSYKLKTTNTTRILKKVFWRNFTNFSRGDFTLLSILNPM